MFGEVVRAHRERLGITQEEVAARAGISIRGLRKIELGQVATPRQGTIRLLAEVFELEGVDRAWFTALARSTEQCRPPGAVQPRQLPAAVAGFAGRARHLAGLSALLGVEGRLPRRKVVILTGAPGVGKTALAVHWAHQVRDRFPDGQLYASLRGHGAARQPVAPAEVLDGFLAALGLPARRVPRGLDARAGLYRSLLADRRVLVVLDDARDVADVRPLLPGGPGCQVVVTSRDKLTGLVTVEGAQPVAVGPLYHSEARQMLVARLGAGRVTAEPDAVEEIITRCARLPRALAITAAKAALQPDLSLARLAAEMQGQARPVQAPEAARIGGSATAVPAGADRILRPPSAQLLG
jgi:transcriptional regulator with XRE-family HTH domain